VRAKTQLLANRLVGFGKGYQDLDLYQTKITLEKCADNAHKQRIASVELGSSKPLEAFPQAVRCQSLF